jgi:hypothetical protein
MVKSYAAMMAELYASSIEAPPPQPTTGEIADAKRLLERFGYAVIKKDRVVTATAETSVALRNFTDWRVPETMVERIEGYLAHQLGEKIVDKGAYTTADGPNRIGTDHRYTFSVTVIMPEIKKP